jgi:predicted cupin superfamily sugar epimerase
MLAGRLYYATDVDISAIWRRNQMLTHQRIVDLLGLKPLRPEGGYYREAYRSDEMLASDVLPDRYGGDRVFGTAIYYLLTPDTFSTMHRISSDEIYHFYLGDPVEMLLLHPDSSSETLIMGHNVLANMSLQAVVKRGVWQGSRLMPGGKFALLGTTTAPGFEVEDYEHGSRDKLVATYPGAQELIVALTT